MGSKTFKFKPLESDLTISFSDGSELYLPKGTYCVGYSRYENKLVVFPRKKPGDVGLGEFNFDSSITSELEEKIEVLK